MQLLMDQMTLPRQMLKSSLHYVERLKVILVNFPYYAVLDFLLNLCNNYDYGVL